MDYWRGKNYGHIRMQTASSEEAAKVVNGTVVIGEQFTMKNNVMKTNMMGNVKKKLR